MLILQDVCSSVVPCRVLVLLRVAPLELSVLPAQDALLDGEELEGEPWAQFLEARLNLRLGLCALPVFSLDLLLALLEDVPVVSGAGNTLAEKEGKRESVSSGTGEEGEGKGGEDGRVGSGH